MKNSYRLGTVGGIAVAATALLGGTSLAATRQPTGSPAGQVFVQTDNTSGNAIVVYDRSSDGMLQQAGTYQTGGWAARKPDQWSTIWPPRARLHSTGHAGCCTR